jgi:hypothetical protein
MQLVHGRIQAVGTAWSRMHEIWCDGHVWRARAGGTRNGLPTAV